jgi:hypothetical protein
MNANVYEMCGVNIPATFQRIYSFFEDNLIYKNLILNEINVNKVKILKVIHTLYNYNLVGNN